MEKRINHLEFLFILGISLFTTFFIFFLFLAQWPEWWKWIIYEQTPMTWMQSTLLYTAAVLAAATAGLSYVEGRKKQLLVYLFLGGGFYFLTLDERFAFHELISDTLLAPNDVKLSLFFWTEPGDFLLLIVMLLGLLSMPWVYSTLKARKTVLYSFLLAVLIACIALLIDSLTFKGWTMESQTLLQFIEEILETVAMLLFVSSMVLALGHILKKLLVDVASIEIESEDYDP